MYSLAPYRISVVKDGKDQKLWAGPNASLSTWVYAYLLERLGKLEQRPGSRMTRVARLAPNKDKTFVCGRYQTGEYGFTSELVDSALNTVSHERTKTEAEMIPFFFSLAVPKQSTWGVLVLQRFRNLGIHDFLVPQMSVDFGVAHPGCRLVVDRLVPSTFVNALYDGAFVKEMRFVSYKMPSAVEDALGSYGFEPHVSEIELAVKAKRNGMLPKISAIKDALSGKGNLSDIVTIPNWDFDAIKLELEVGGRRRTVDIGKPYKVTPNIDITEDVAQGPDGHPIWEEIVTVTAQFCGELLSAEGVKVGVDSTLAEVCDAPKLKVEDVMLVSAGHVGNDMNEAVTTEGG